MPEKSITDKLQELFVLFESGALTKEEYEKLKVQTIEALKNQQIDYPNIGGTNSPGKGKTVEAQTNEKSDPRKDIKPENPAEIHLNPERKGRIFKYLTVLVLLLVIISGVALINRNKLSKKSNESVQPRSAIENKKGWDEEAAKSIIINELSKFPDWTKIANGDSPEWIHEIVRFEKMNLNKRELMVALVNSKYKFGRQLSVFEFEHHKKWNLTNKSIAFSQGEFSSSTNEKYIYRIALDNYGLILKNTYGIRNSNVIEKYLYAFVKGGFKEIFSAHATVSQMDNDPDFKMNLIAKDDGYYDLESLDDGKGAIYERDKIFLYKFNGNEYVKASNEKSRMNESSIEDSSNFNEIVISILKSYYYDFNNNTRNFDASKFFANQVERYITFKNTTPEAISKYMQTDFIKEFINPDFGFEPDSFSIIQQGDNYVAEYIEVSNCFRKSRQKNQKVRVHVKAILNSNYKITYFSEYDVIENIFY